MGLVMNFYDFSDLSWLFSCDNNNRGVIQQNFDEAALLWKAVQATRGPILEIGRFHGGTTVLLVAAGAGRCVVSLDIAPKHHPECEKFFDEVHASSPGILSLLVKDSGVPLPGQSFGMLFIDGDHTYDGVKRDTIAHWPALHPFDGRAALAVYHDAVPNDGLLHRNLPNHCEGVQQLCKELVDLQCARVIGSAGSSLVLEKLAELPNDWTQSILYSTASYTSLSRRCDIVTLAKPGGIGVELGVAEGQFSERLLKRGTLSYLYSIDMYAGDRGHDLLQYKRAISRLMPYKSQNSLLKMKFDEAVDLFDDEYFDIIYIDGYAHTGQESGKTIHDWYQKLKPGGVFAGDDYHPQWPLVIDAVNSFVEKKGLKLHVLNCQEQSAFSYFPTWFVFKPE